MKPLSPVHLTRTSDFDYSLYAIGVGTGPALDGATRLEDLFRPQFWQHHAKRLKAGDLIRVRAVNGAFDVMLNVVNALPGGVVVEPWPKTTNAATDLEAIANTARVEYVPQKKQGKPVPRVEFTPATRWRVIGLDGGEFSRGHATEDLATENMAKMLRDMGIERIQGMPEPDAEPQPAAPSEVKAKAKSAPKTKPKKAA